MAQHWFLPPPSPEKNPVSAPERHNTPRQDIECVYNNPTQSLITALHSTALRNHIRTVFEEMTSWTALTWYVGMKTVF